MLRSRAMLELLLVGFLSLTLSIAKAAITCDSGCNGGSSGVDQVCTAETVTQKPWSNETQTTPPAIRFFSVSAYPAASSSGYALNITWTQKWSDVEYVDGYYLTVQMLGDRQSKLKFDLNKGMLRSENKGVATFSYLCYGRTAETTLFPGSMYYVKIHSMPLHNFHDKDSFQSTTVKIPRGAPRVDNPWDYGGYEPDDPSESLDSDQNIVPQFSTKAFTTERKPAIPGAAEIATKHTKTTLNRRDASSEPCVPLHMVIIACVLSVIGVTFVVLFFSLLYLLFCSSISGKLLKRRRKRSVVKTVSEKYSEPRKPRILVVASMAQDEPVHKSTALCLAKVLQDSGEFQVSCNLSMTQQIAKQGVALWANSAVESNDKIVLLCHPTTESVLRKAPFREWCCPEDACCNDYPSAEIVLNLISDPRKKARKLVLVCPDDVSHACLSNAPLPYAHKWEKFVIAKQFPQLAKCLLDGTQRRLKNRAVEALQNRIEANLIAIKEKHKTRGVFDEGNNNDAPHLQDPLDVALESEPLMCDADHADAARPNVPVSKPLLDDLHSPTHPQFRSVICNRNSQIVSCPEGRRAPRSSRRYDAAPTMDYTAGARPKRPNKI